jgi:hypothetical protein
MIPGGIDVNEGRIRWGFELLADGARPSAYNPAGEI